MKTSPIFAPDSAAVDRLVAEHPFAQLISAEADGFACTPLPLLLERDGANSAWLIGHLARANPHVARLRERPRALAVFLGAHGYVSPSWLRDRSQAPTWNFETAHFDVHVELDETGRHSHCALQRLVAHMELGRAQPWSSVELGARYTALEGAIIAFRARVLGVRAKFKLGQNERADVYADILAALERKGERDLSAAMRRANTGRAAAPSGAAIIAR